MRRAVQNSGVAVPQTLDAIVNEATQTPAIQQAFSQQLRTDIIHRTSADPDYNSQRFPHTENFIKK